MDIQKELSDAIGENSLPFTLRVKLAKGHTIVYLDLEMDLDPVQSVVVVRSFNPRWGEKEIECLTIEEFESEQDRIFDVYEKRGLVYKGCTCIKNPEPGKPEEKNV